MYCVACGHPNEAEARYCSACGAPMPGTPVAPPTRPPAYDAAKELVGLVPVNTDGWCIAAGYLGLFAVLGIFAPFALITGILGLRSLNKRPGRRGHVRAWLGVVMGAMCTLLYGMGLIAIITG
jgi:hypothetical protein